MHILRKFIAGALFISVVALFIPFFFNFLLLKTYLSPVFLERTFIPKSYESAGIFIKEADVFKDDKTEGAVQDVIEKFLTKDRYVFLARSALMSVLDGIRSLDNNESVRISLTGTKQALFVEIKNYVKSLPDCEADEIPEEDFCAPSSFPESAKEQFRDQIAKSLIRMADGIIPESFLMVENENFPWVRYISFLLKWRIEIMSGMILIFVILLVLMAVSVYKPFYAVLRWEGYAFLIFILEAFGFFFLFDNVPIMLEKAGISDEGIKRFAEWIFSFPVSYILLSGAIFAISAILFFGLSFYFFKQSSVKE